MSVANLIIKVTFSLLVIATLGLEVQDFEAVCLLVQSTLNQNYTA